MVIQYKCPNCGADMIYDIDSGSLHCNSCGRKDSIENMPMPDIPEGGSSEAPDIDLFDTSDIQDETGYKYTEEHNPKTFFDSDKVRQYHCKNCGAMVLTDNDTSATTCSFCNAATVLSDRLSGEYAPAKVIPFKITKEQAQTAFKKWCRNGRLTPKDFMTSDRIKSITGIYIPFWLYDVNAKGDVDATCTRKKTYTRGDYIFTETSYYHVYRKVDLNYLKIPADASEKMDDKLMDRIEPFDYTDLKDFNMPYLAGYIAERYNYTDTQLFPRIKQRVQQYFDQYINSSITGYSTTSYNRRSSDIKQRNAFYTLLPIWMVCYDYKDSEHIFAMNGQTGKIVGKPPLGKSKIAAWFIGIAGISFAIMQILTQILFMF